MVPRSALVVCPHPAAGEERLLGPSPSSPTLVTPPHHPDLYHHLCKKLILPPLRELHNWFWPTGYIVTWTTFQMVEHLFNRLPCVVIDSLDTHISLSLSSSSWPPPWAFQFLYLSIKSTKYAVFLAFRIKGCFSNSLAVGLCWKSKECIIKQKLHEKETSHTSISGHITNHKGNISHTCLKSVRLCRH